MKRMCAECGGLDFSVHYDDVTVARMMHLMVCFECLTKVTAKAMAALKEQVKA